MQTVNPLFSQILRPRAPDADKKTEAYRDGMPPVISLG